MVKQPKSPKKPGQIRRSEAKKKSFIYGIILILLFSCQQKRDFIFNDDDIRYIVTEHRDNHNCKFPKFMIDIAKYDRVLISKNLLGNADKQAINVFEIYPDRGIKEIIAVRDRFNFPGNTGVIPYVHGNFFVFDIDKFPTINLFLIFDVPPGERSSSPRPCGFEMEIFDKKAFSKQS